MDFSSRPPRTRTRAAWKDLAEDLVSDGVRVYQMDCDNKENKKACKLAKVQSYPTIKLCVRLACILEWSPMRASSRPVSR